MSFWEEAYMFMNRITGWACLWKQSPGLDSRGPVILRFCIFVLKVIQVILFSPEPMKAAYEQGIHGFKIPHP